eukprot:TRINITY_DN2801_c0_g2_i2.p1 TRINITY_DN2801_c0_g2~~TRINITY_DN2801_c0_g2_i2.p1  ORF type:complete len:163 (-),score=39.89 TRINITY_DN2801_c0_g2_i2:28-516(-)
MANCSDKVWPVLLAWPDAIWALTGIVQVKTKLCIDLLRDAHEAMAFAFLGCAVPKVHFRYMDYEFKAACKTVLLAQNRDQDSELREPGLFAVLPKPVLFILLAQLAQKWVSGPPGRDRAAMESVVAQEGVEAAVELLDRGSQVRFREQGSFAFKGWQELGRD